MSQFDLGLYTCNPSPRRNSYDCAIKNLQKVSFKQSLQSTRSSFKQGIISITPKGQAYSSKRFTFDTDVCQSKIRKIKPNLPRADSLQSKINNLRDSIGKLSSIVHSKPTQKISFPYSSYSTKSNTNQSYISQAPQIDLHTPYDLSNYLNPGPIISRHTLEPEHIDFCSSFATLDESIVSSKFIPKKSKSQAMICSQSKIPRPKYLLNSPKTERESLAYYHAINYKGQLCSIDKKVKLEIGAKAMRQYVVSGDETKDGFVVYRSISEAIVKGKSIVVDDGVILKVKVLGKGIKLANSAEVYSVIVPIDILSYY